MAVVGLAEVLIRPVFSGLQNQITKDLVNPLGRSAAPAGQKLGAGVRTGASKELKRADLLAELTPEKNRVLKSGQTIGKWMSRGVKATLATATAAMGVVLAKGWNRLLALDTAKGQLRGLKLNSKQIEAVMGDVLKSVKGTAFGLDEAAQAAAGALGAGIKPGKALTRQLKLVGDMATTSGSDFGHLARIMDRVEGSGRLTGQTMQQLTDNGVQVMPALKKAFGGSTEEIRKMVSAGKISAEDFRKAMEKDIGGAALASGDTMKGAIANMWASVGRIGANLLEGLFPQIRGGVNALTGWLGGIEEKAADAGKAVGKWVRDVIVPTFKDIGKWVIEHKEPIIAFGKAVAGAALALGALSILTKVYRWGQDLIVLFKGLGALMAANPVGVAIGIITALVGVLTWAYQKFEPFRDVVDAVFEGLGRAAEVVWVKHLKPFFDGVVGFFKDTAPKVAVWYKQSIEPIFDGIAEAAREIWDLKLAPALKDLGYAAADLQKNFQNFVESEGVREVLQGLGDILSWVSTEVIPGFITIAGHQFLLTLEGLALAIGLVTEGTRLVSKGFEGLSYVSGPGMSDFITSKLVPAVQIFSDLWSPIAGLIDFTGRQFKLFGESMALVYDLTIAPVIMLFESLFGEMATKIIGFSVSMLLGWTEMSLGVKQFFDQTVTPTLVAFMTLGRDLMNFILQQVLAPMMVGFSNFYHQSVKPIFDAAGEKINQFRNTMAASRDAIRPILEQIGRFFGDLIVKPLESAVMTIDIAMRAMRLSFSGPINWLIQNAWNNGLVRSFNSVAQAVGSKARLSPMDPIPAYAKGGLAMPGWALVGEEGPEIIKLGMSGRVLTANQTREAYAEALRGDLSDDEAKVAAGARPADSMLPMGGTVADNLASSYVSVASALSDLVTESVRDLAAKVLDPMKAAARQRAAAGGPVGVMTTDGFLKMMDMVLGWAGKQEETFGGYMGKPPSNGRWVRPSRGPVTSRYGPRWGGWHAGIDIAGGGPTFSPAAGKVLKTGWNLITGRTGVGIIIDHGGGHYSYLGHNPVGGVRVRPGDIVKAGQHVGYQGATGNVTGVHVHYEHHRPRLGRDINPEFMGVFDQGGILNPGISVVANYSGKPEAVLTNAQMQDMKQLAAHARKLAGTGEQHTYYVDASDKVSAEELFGHLDFQRRRKQKGGVNA